jgi:hypothetical protein
MLGLPIIFWQVLIAVLRMVGMTTWAQNLSLKLIVWLEAKAKAAKSYHENADFAEPYPGQTNISNIEVKQP